MPTTGKSWSKLPTALCGYEPCGATVRIEKHRRPAYDRGEPVYCNREHRMAAVGRQVTVTCALPSCGIEFQKHAADVERGGPNFYCTREHAQKGAPKPRTGGEVPCDACGTPVYLRPSDLAEHEAGAKHYCDMHCKAAGMRGERVERDEQTCIVCGTTWRRNLDQMRQDVKTCKRECTDKSKRSPEGHRWIDPRKGYVWITAPDGRRMQEHTYVMEQEFGGPLPEGSTVHHKKGGFEGRSNNDPSNLELWTGNHPKGHRVEDVTDYCLDHEETYLGMMSDEQLARLAALGREATARLGAVRWPLLREA